MPRLRKRKQDESKVLPIVGANKGRKPGEGVRDDDLKAGETHTRQHTHQEPADIQMEETPEPLNGAPPKTIRVIKFPKGDPPPTAISKQTIDVRKDQHLFDQNLNNIPDFQEEWGDGKGWKTGRRAERVFVAPEDIPDHSELHGWYVVFAVYDPDYRPSTHTIFKGQGRHLHDDIFIAKMTNKRDGNGWTVWMDVPREFLSAMTKDGRKVYQIQLAETRKAMLGSLLGW